MTGPFRKFAPTWYRPALCLREGAVAVFQLAGREHLAVFLDRWTAFYEVDEPRALRVERLGGAELHGVDVALMSLSSFSWFAFMEVQMG